MTEYKSTDLEARLAHLKTLQAAARLITLPLFHDGMSVVNKAENGYDPVTNADMDGERKLRALIQHEFPNDHIAGEEFDDLIGSNDWLWTLDPIDGTRAFVAGIPVWSTLIALSFQGRPVLGLIDHPALDLSFWGTPDGAWREDMSGKSPLSVKPCADLQGAILGCTEPLSMLNAGELAAYNVIRRGVRFSRLGLDAYAYGMIASGRMDIVIESGLKPCDVRALIPIVEGAGGRMTNWHGGSCIDGGQVVAVGDVALLPELYTYLGRAMTP